MGALLSKPIASTSRLWDLSSYKTYDYLNTLCLTEITVYLFAGKAVKILPSNTWISDRTRFSFDGWSRQRLSFCYYEGRRVSWFRAFALFSKRVLNKRVAFHWSSVESLSVVPFVEAVSKLSSLSLPYTNLSKTSSFVTESLNKSYSYRWSVYENYPTLLSDSLPFLYKADSSIVLVPPYLQPILTASEETELSPLCGSFSTTDCSSTVCLIQTEHVTSTGFSIYFGTHGYINAQQAQLLFPILMAYERTNSVTGQYFIRGPAFSRSLISFSFVLFQLHSNFFGSKKFEYALSKPYTVFSSIIDKNLNFTLSRSKFLFIFRQPPQYEVSPLVQILDSFVRHE